MKKICNRGKDWIQVFNSDGMVRLCSWTGQDGWIGSLLDHTLPEIFHGEKATKLREKLLKQDYSSCSVDDCPLLMTGTIETFQTELGELPEYPEQLHLAFENTCNYRCPSCNIHCRDAGKDKEQIEHNYDIIESRLREALPHAKIISANGQGEVFCNKRTMRLLSEWEPLAPTEECQVWLETNGSLFDEEHWKQIENIGKYYVRVAITVMSFDQAIYEHLSGAKYPISKIEDNLRFVKSLREKNIINYIELATVVQAENFREMPEFARRCIEEFGADRVRLRPYANWGAQDCIEEFFMDIRNPMHPYHQEYKEVMKHPYISHPKVAEESGGNSTYRTRTVPYEDDSLKWRLMTYILWNQDKVLDSLECRSGGKDIILYGRGNFTAMLLPKMKERGITPACIIDSYYETGDYEGIPLYNIKDMEKIKIGEAMAIITPITDFPTIKRKLISDGVCQDAIPLWELTDAKKLKERLEYVNMLL
ncbi:MAG: radical SAM protein [Lachnospiraceae bacterium]|nr:radical SAM protein [Lachnospiraceae bacterium]